ncbi:MAG TPA: diacylglycerol kinase [Opitutaceae bacterium]|nr:diacylglycerol kinase [Opitutaceae bacterium]
MPTEHVELVEPKRRNFRNFIRSISYALSGFSAALKHEPSFREDLVFAILLVPFTVILRVKAIESAVMIASLFLIIIVELLNSAIEWTIDYISTAEHPMAKRAKDMASAAVFVTYINCVVVWAIILSTKWSHLW